MGFSQQVKTSINGDEYYTPQNAVDMILPYIIKGGYKNIWCPFDKEESKFVQTFKSHGLNVVYGHIYLTTRSFLMIQSFSNYIEKTLEWSERY